MQQRVNVYIIHDDFIIRKNTEFIVLLDNKGQNNYLKY